MCEKKEEPVENQFVNQVNNLISEYLTSNYSCEDNNYVEKEENKNGIIILYTKMDCPEKRADLPIVDFGECYNTMKKENNISEDEDLIIAQVKTKNDKSETFSSYAFYNPKTGEPIDSSVCKDNITVEENLNDIVNKLKKNKEDIYDLIEQGINIFDCKNEEFFNDFCYSYIPQNGKDAPLKVRIKEFCPVITLCDAGCENVGVDLQEMRAKCECKFINLVDIDKLGDNLYTRAINDVLDVVKELNIAVVKCFMGIFDREKFLKCTGGFIILSLFFGELICYIIFMVDGLYNIRKYLHALTQSFLDFISNSLPSNILFLNNPPIKRLKINNCIVNDFEKKNSTFKLNNINSKNNFIESFNLGKKKINFNKNKKKSSFSKRNKNDNKKPTIKISFIEKKINKKTPKKYLINMKEYLSLSFDENDFDDVVDKDKRSFCKFFGGVFIENQIFISTFFIKETLRPLPLKLLVLLMTIEVYFTITALFYNEDYLTDLYYSKKEEKFFSFIQRRYNQFAYSIFAGMAISYLVGFFFIEEKKIKKIFIRNKQSELKMKYEISVTMKDIERRFIGLICFSFFLTIICFIYISCFNNVYPCIKYEWIKSSIFVIILMQIIQFCISLIQCIFRYIAIKFNSEKLFKLSLLFNL